MQNTDASLTHSSPIGSQTLKHCTCLDIFLIFTSHKILENDLVVSPDTVNVCAFCTHWSTATPTQGGRKQHCTLIPGYSYINGRDNV